MSILIKGMEMPQGCYNCPLQHRGFNGSETVHYCYVIAKEVADDGETDTDCPLIEVPTPHGRLIDADMFQQQMYERNFDGRLSECWLALVNLFLSVAPTVIEVEDK